MRRAAAFLFSSLAFAACGSRTGLGLEATESDAQADAADAQADGDALAEAEAGTETGPPVEAGPRFCPLTPPSDNTTCPSSTPDGTQCTYVMLPPPAKPRVDWCCVGGGWVLCTTISSGTQTCSQIVCTPGVPVECISGEGKKCCGCDTPKGTVSNCGPC